MTPRIITVDLKRSKCEMKRISPADYRRLYQRSVPIVEIYDCSYFLDRMVKHEAYSAFRARLYASLRTLFGETTNDYDGFKCSFGYLFGLKLTGEVQQSEYTMIFLDIKGGMNFLFRKVYTTEKECGDRFEREVLRTPFEDEFSEDEMEYLMVWFVFYLAGFMDSFEPNYDHLFARNQDYCLTIYGYRDGQFFEDVYDNHESYSSAKQLILERNEIPMNDTLSWEAFEKQA